MSLAADLPLWAAIAVAACLIAGSLLTLIGAIGLLSLKTYYDRLHAPTLGTSFGTVFILLGSALFFSIAQTRLVVHEIVIAVLITVTTPVTLMLLGGVALHRDRLEAKSARAEERDLT